MNSTTLYPDLPRLAVGAVVLHRGKILLVLRAKAPAKGEWAIPGGSVKLGETLQAAAEREILEETGLVIKAGEVIYTFEAIQRDETGRVKYHYVIVDLAAELHPDSPLSLTPADDVSDAGWFALNQLDQDDFPVSPATRALIKKVLT